MPMGTSKSSQILHDELGRLRPHLLAFNRLSGTLSIRVECNLEVFLLVSYNDGNHPAEYECVTTTFDIQTKVVRENEGVRIKLDDAH